MYFPKTALISVRKKKQNTGNTCYYFQSESTNSVNTINEKICIDKELEEHNKLCWKMFIFKAAYIDRNAAALHKNMLVFRKLLRD